MNQFPIPQEDNALPTTTELYGMLHQGNAGDIAFYLDLCQGAQDILELGCGQGRFLLPFARQGFHVTGLDQEAAMLHIAQKTIDAHQVPLSPIKLIQADMCDFQLDQQYDRVLIPFNSLYCLSDDDAILRCFHASRKHLRPDGLFLFDVYTVDEESFLETSDGSEFVAAFQGEKHYIEIFEKTVWKPETQHIEVTYIHHILQGQKDHILEYTVPQHYLTPQQLKTLLREAGFSIRHFAGDFNGGAFDPHESFHMIVCAEHAPR